MSSNANQIQSAGRLAIIINKMVSEPFRFFFVYGILMALVGVGYWPIKIFTDSFADLSSAFHVHIMIYGFMHSFVLGFLTTAAPRLTQSFTATRFEFLSLVFLETLIVTAVFGENYRLANTTFAVSILFLLFFFFRRFRHFRKTPPVSFVFLPIGFAAALFGSLTLVFTDAALHPVSIAMARGLVFQGYLLCLLMGVGGFLIRSIWGHAPALPQNSSQQLVLPPFNKPLFILNAVCGLSLVASYVLQFHVSEILGLSLRAAALLIVSLFSLQIHKKISGSKLTAVTLKISMLLILVGHILLLVVPKDYQIEVYHLIFVSGFSLAAIAVATRVICSHCGASQLLNGRYLPFTITVTLILVGALGRATIMLASDSYYVHLAIYAFSWISGILVWSVAILGRNCADTLTTEISAEQNC